MSVTISQRRWACVLDPTLAFSNYGLPLVKQLRGVMELWVGREFWHILDNTYFYLRQPESLLSNKVGRTLKSGPVNPQQFIRILQAWERTRIETDSANLGLCWVGDSPNESFLPEDKDSNLIWRCERLSASLDSRLNTTGALAALYRDTVALAVAEGRSVVLTHLPESDSGDFPPDICTMLQEWGIPCEPVASGCAWMALERDYLRQLIVQAGLARLRWAGLRLAVLQLVVPAASTLAATPLEATPVTDLDVTLDLEQNPQPEADLWQGAQGFWYAL
jgi:hypothetical protein